MIEISRKFEGYNSKKWLGDLTKLYAGCLAILRDLKEVVSHHAPTVTKLAAAAVLQVGMSSGTLPIPESRQPCIASSADFLIVGPTTMVLIMSCIGPNLYYPKRSPPLNLPCDVDNFDDLGDILINVWRARVGIIRAPVLPWDTIGHMLLGNCSTFSSSCQRILQRD